MVETHVQQIQDEGWPPYWTNRKITILLSQQRLDWSTRNLVWWRVLTLFTLTAIKCLNF